MISPALFAGDHVTIHDLKIASEILVDVEEHFPGDRRVGTAPLLCCFLRCVISRGVAVIDEFPFLVKASPALPSIIQRELGPGGSGGHSTVRLLLCGSAMPVMGQLLAGHAPLRGRASLELLTRPFGYRDAARFWDVHEPELAVLLHAIVGGTPAYRREFVAFDAPVDRADFDSWVCEPC